LNEHQFFFPNHALGLIGMFNWIIFIIGSSGPVMDRKLDNPNQTKGYCQVPLKSCYCQDFPYS
jgi:hypothetical protein